MNILVVSTHTSYEYDKKHEEEDMAGKTEWSGLSQNRSDTGTMGTENRSRQMVILTPKIIDSFIRTIPKGKLTSVNLIREKFAQQYHADTTCPLTTGIFIWISAGAAEEDRAAGKKKTTPYWRVLKEGGKLNPKFPGGVTQQSKYLESEGFEIIKGKTDTSWTVRDYKSYLV